MNKIMEMRNKRNTLWEQTKAFLEEHRGENGLVEPHHPLELSGGPPLLEGGAVSGSGLHFCGQTAQPRSRRRHGIRSGDL